MGAMPVKPSAPVSFSGNFPVKTLARYLPSGWAWLPQMKSRFSWPPRAASSHSASVGRRFLAQVA